MRSFFFSLSLFFISPLSAQFFPLTELNPQINQNTRVFSFADEQGLSLLFMDQSEAELYLLDPSLKMYQRFELRDLPAGERIQRVGFSNSPDALHIYYRELDSEEYQLLSIFKNNGETARFRMDLRERSTFTHGGAFTYLGNLHIVRLPRSQSAIRICRFEGQNFETQDFPLERLDFSALAGYELPTIATDTLIRLTHTYPAAKMYHFGPFLHMSLDESDATYLISVDLRSDEKIEQRLPGPLADSSLLRNSLIWQNYLIQFAMNTDSMSLFLRDIHSGDLLAQYHGGKSPLAFQEGPFIHSQPGLNAQNYTAVEAFLQNATEAAYAAIAIRSGPDSLLNLEIGTVKPTGLRGVSGLVLDQEFELHQFSGMLHLMDLQPVPARNLRLQESGLSEEAPLFTRFKINGAYYMGYYDPTSRRYLIGH